MNDTQIIDLTELADFSCEPTASMRDVLARINASAFAFQLVVDSDRRLLGTITDGDVRRALLAGAVMDSPVERFMNADPKTGSSDDVTQAKWLLGEIRSMIPFLPLLDRDGRLACVLTKRAGRNENPAALIMAGGRGSRLGDQTRRTPKPLLTVRGVPILEHVLRHIETVGIREVFVSTHYLSKQIEDFCRSRDGGALLTVLTEDAPRGTAGAISMLPSDISVPVLVMNGDVVSSADLAAMLTLHSYQAWDATIAVATHEWQIPYGVVRVDAEAGFLGIEEKPRVRHFVAAGIYLLNDRIRQLVPKGRHVDMPELLEMGRDAGLKLGVFPIHEKWRDVGRPADLEAANDEAEIKIAGD